MTQARELTIRHLRDDDLEDLAALERASFAGEDPDVGAPCVSEQAWTAQDLYRAADRVRRRCLVVEEGSLNVVGYALVRLEDYGICVLRILVHPQYRRSGVGRALLERLLRPLVRSPYRKTLRAFVPLHNHALCRWLARKGFTSKLLSGDQVEMTFTTSDFSRRKKRS